MYKGKFFRMSILAGAVLGGFCNIDAWASSVPPSGLFIDEPGMVLMVDGTDRNSKVTVSARLDAPRRSGFDFGFMSGGGFFSLTGKSRTQGSYTFTGGALVDFALRNRGLDGRFGTSDDLLYRLSDGAGYAVQHYFAPIDPAKSQNPVVTDIYFQNLNLNWDLNLDGTPDVRVRLRVKGSPYDGMAPAPLTVSILPASWLLGSGLTMLGMTGRRRYRARNQTS